jgi:uncharacterized protein YqgV (UPF0045/DUF77 family)
MIPKNLVNLKEMKMMMNKVNVAFQVLPEADGEISYRVVDEAIRVITESGLTFRVCPFETVVECTLTEATDLVHKIHKACEKAGTRRMLTYLKIQADFTKDVEISDKMEKYDNF